MYHNLEEVACHFKENMLRSWTGCSLIPGADCKSQRHPKLASCLFLDLSFIKKRRSALQVGNFLQVQMVQSVSQNLIQYLLLLMPTCHSFSDKSHVSVRLADGTGKRYTVSFSLLQRIIALNFMLSLVLCSTLYFDPMISVHHPIRSSCIAI